MAPRGRPPGRKSGLPSRLQTATAASTPSPAATSTPTPTPTGPPAKKGKKGKVGRPPKESPPDAPAGKEIHVAPAAVVTPVPVPVLDDEPETTLIMENKANGQPDGEPSHTREPSPLPDESNTADDKSVVETEAPSSSARAVHPPSRSKPMNGFAGRGGRAESARNGASGYTASNIDLDVISYRQLNEDIAAYHVDLDFCDSQLAQDNLTPQETRTLQLRRLDLSHQIRFSEHRKETLEAQRALKGGRPLSRAVPSTPHVAATNGHTAGRRPVPHSAPKRRLSVSAENGNGSASVPNKRPRAVSELSVQDTISMHSNDATSSANGGGGAADGGAADDGGSDIGVAANSSVFGKAEDGEFSVSVHGHVRRLGFWKCRLCVSEKYMYAGPDRLPNAPSKWPLKDMGKLMSHYFDLHTEHDPEERCAELGDALDNNRGPFEHWLRKSRAQKIPDPSIIDETISELQAGRVPKLLRDLCRAAAAFPGA